jgi:asparagine synthase (glutamine-hydrolysing)
MVSDDGRYILIYNGELYNFRELREELKKLGRKIESSGDTEVLLEALSFWGIEAIKRFNGMFAFAFYDLTLQKLYLGRDRYGVKPLYYAFLGETLVFASEEKAFKNISFFSMGIDTEALVEYFTFQNVITEKTFYRGISLVPAGSYLELQVDSNEFRHSIKKYWDFNFCENNELSNQKDVEDEIERLLIQAVRRNLLSDVEIAQYLSGGIDTGLIASIAAQETAGMKSFTVGFDVHNVSGLEMGFDERVHALEIARSLGMEYSDYVVKSGDLQDALVPLTWAIDTPRVGQSYPNFYAAKLASKKVKIVLSGTGSDEIFAGYPWRYFLGKEFKNYNDYAESYYNYWQRLIKDEEKSSFFEPIWKDINHVETSVIFRNILRGHGSDFRKNQITVNNSLYFEAKTFLAGLLNIEDKIHMHFGIENRVPFLDNDLVDFVMKLPLEFKLNTNLHQYKLDENTIGDKKRLVSTEASGKLILQSIYKKRLPDRGGWQKKQGFAAPDESWFRNANFGLIERELRNKNNEIYNFVSFSAVNAMLERHMSGRRNMRLLIWSLLTFKKWIDINL